MMKLFVENKGEYIDEFSQEFELNFLDILKRKYLNKRTLANKIYTDYISNKMHTHMNATKWTTLAEFVEVIF